MPMDIETTDQDGLTIIKATGEVDMESSPAFRGALLTALGKANKGVGIDMSAVPYMDSSGAATLVESMRAADAKKIRFFLLSPSDSVMKVLKLMHLASVFEICDSV